MRPLKMRISPSQTKQIVSIVQSNLGDDAVIRLFGSRADDGKKGGDVDLYVEIPESANRNAVSSAKRCLEDALEMKVDLVVNDVGRADDLPIVEIAKKTGILLCRK